MSLDRHRFAVVLAGGEGSRFWPASRPERPKQLLPLAGEHPLIAETVRRAEKLVGLDSVRVVAGSSLVEPLIEATPELDHSLFLIEPVARSTGPALVWAASVLESHAPGALLISLHADHAIHPLRELEATVDLAAAAAERGSLVCIGAKPDRPETGYGYIEIGEKTGERTWRAARFVEKPDGETARSYVESGRHLWNTGIFVWRAAAFLEAVRELTPEIATALPLLAEEGPAAFFREVEPISVDVAVMERCSRVEVVQASFEWDDVGSWNSLARMREGDDRGNVTVGTAIAVDADENVVWAEEGEIVLFGVRDLVVVSSGGRTLVTTREAAANLRELVDRIREGGA
jgi:mannose-1-phosphate guanylyltransferase